jgi:hypothetical protein
MKRKITKKWRCRKTKGTICPKRNYDSPPLIGNEKFCKKCEHGKDKE